MSNNLSIGFSPCPNDTFIFYALVHGKIAMGDLDFQEPLLEDVEKLNVWAQSGKLDVTKISCHALGHVLDEYCVLSAGSALGRGCGPLLVAGAGLEAMKFTGRRIAIPGRLTTAALLLQMFLPERCELVEMRFDRIMDAVCSGEVDAGVIIHESRFTYRERGLVCLQDLGEWWEKSFGLPIPLGCIVARRSLGEAKIRAIDRAIRESVDYAFRYPDRCLPYIRSKSQEMEEAVVRSHIGLYVNDFSKDLGPEGWSAIAAFLEKGRNAGVLPASSRSISRE